MEQNSKSIEQVTTQKGKKKWIDPEIVILAINDATLGAAGINDDGATFES